MRNLKKVLALVLALVMSLSLVTIASAADFTDASAISDEEAVTVMSALGIIEGNEDGSFNPAGTLTREQAAKIIAYILLGPTAADKLGGVSAFKDVPANRWSAGYISYCASLDIIAGNGDGTFNPTGKLTGYAFAKMLLTALGYDASIEGYVGSGWQVNVAAKVVKLKLNDGIDTVLSNQLTRQEACRMALNALSTMTVGYQNKGTTVTTGDGTTVEIGNTAASVSYGSGLLYKVAYDKVVDKWGHDLVGCNASGNATNEGEVTAVANTTDSFERPAREYKVNGETYIFAKEADLTYTTEVKLGDIYKDLGLSKNISDDTKITFHVDGAAEAASGNSNNGNSLATMTLTKGDNTNKIGGNGVLTQVYYDSTAETAVITMVNTYIGDVVSVTNATSNADRYVTITGRNATAGKFETETLAKEDAVLYTYSKKTGDTGVKSAVVAEKVTGQLTGYSAGKTLVVDGTTYSYSAKVDTTADSSSLKIDVDVYLDSYGYAIDVEGVKTDAEYAYVLKHTATGGAYGSDEIAQLLLADGTVADVTVKTNNGSAGKDDMVSYTVDSNGKYTITKVMDLTAITNAKTLSIVKGSSTVTLDSNTPTTVKADGKTMFLVVTGTADEPVYTAYTGIANVPSITVTGNGTSGVYAYAVKSGVAQVVYVDARGAIVNADATDIVYIAGDAKSAKVTDADGDYYVYNAVVNGEITTLKVDATLAAAQGLTIGTNTVYKSVNYNTKGIVVSVGTAGISGTGTDKESNGTIGLNNAYYVYTSDCQVFYVDKDENITVSSIGAITKDSTDTVKFVTNSDGKVVAIFVEEQISALSAIQASGHKVYVNGEAATVTSESATAATITSTVKAGDVITIAPAVSPMATVSSSLSGTGSATGTKTAGLAGYTVVAGDTGSKTIDFSVVVVSESGVAAGAVQFTVTLPVALG